MTIPATVHDIMRWRCLIMLIVGGAMVWTPTESSGPLNSEAKIDCNASCSAQVSCSIQRAPMSLREIVHIKQDFNIPGEPFGLNFIQSNDSKYQYFNFTWNIPQDGFLVNIRILGGDGFVDEHFYLLQLASNWSSNVQNTMDKKGAIVFLPCVKVYKESQGTIVAKIYSLPVNLDSPKRAQLSISLNPGRWKPKLILKKGADILHITLLNPLPSVEKYIFLLSSTTQGGRGINKLEVITAVNSSEWKEFSAININFTVPDIYKKDLLLIQIETVEHSDDQSMPKLIYELHFDFSVPTNHPPIDDNRLIIILITVSIAVVAIALVCVFCRVKIRHKVRRWLFSSSPPGPLRKNKMKLPTIFPIYCYENDTYVKAVQCHLSLLRHFVGQSSLPLCDYVSQDCSWVQSQIQNSSILIYLSPKFRELLQADVDTSGLCPLDALCVLSLHSLQQVMLRDANSSKPCIVYLDCFQDTLTDIQDLLLSQSQTEIQLMPMKLASLNGNIWQLENLDQLFKQLFRVAKLSPKFSESLYGWKESKEAKDLEKQLSLISQVQLNTDNTEVHLTNTEVHLTDTEVHLTDTEVHLTRDMPFTPSQNKNKMYSLDTVFMEDVIASDVQSLDDNVHPYEEAVDGMETEMARKVPLMSGSSGFHSGSFDQELNSLNHPTTELSTNKSEGNRDLSHMWATECVKFMPSGSSCNRPFLDYSFDDCHPSVLQSLIYSKKPVGTVGSLMANGVKNSSDLEHQREPLFLSPSANGNWSKSNGHAFCHNLQIIPPNLCLSSSTSIESVSERINRVNESNLNNV